MSSFVTSLNYYITTFVSWITFPFSKFISDFFSLSVLSIIIGVVFAYFYGKLSSQDKIKGTKQEIGASLLESVLFRHDPFVTLKAQGGLLLGGIKYLGTTFIPILILFVPSILLFSAVQNNFGFENSIPKEGEELIITVNSDQSPFDYSVKAAGDIIASSPLRILESRELIHKISNRGDLTANRTIELKTPSLTLDLSRLLTRQQPSLMTSSLLDAFFFGALSTPPEGIHSISVNKSFKDYSMLGFVWPWYIWSIIFILIGGFAGAKILGISF